MRWTDELFYILIFNCITGAIAYGLWILLKMNMARRKKLKYVYPMLGIVEAFFIFPIMYIYLKISTHVPGRHGMYYGTLFLRTPFIYNVQCVIAGIWIVGAVWNLAKYAFKYWKFQKVLEKSVSFRLPETEKNKIIQELGMKGNVELYQNYAVTSPIVIGWRQKKIIFLVREYEEKELTTILYHELVHIRQHILEMKKMGIFLKLIFWCNPMMNGLLRSIDMWGEIACDRYVCSETAYPYTVQEYYTVAVDGLEQSHLWMPKMVTGFRKKSNFKAGYERLFAQTKVEVEDVVVEETEYEENFDASKVTIVYDGNEEQLPQGNGDLTEQKLGKSEAAVWENIRISGQNMITVSLSNNPFENEVRYGLIMPDGKLRYVYGSGMCSHAFEVGSAGTYKIYVENVSSSSITVSGGYLYN